MQFSSNLIKLVISLFLGFFIISCAQFQSASEKQDKTKTAKQESLEKQVEKRDIKLPSGSTILEDGSGMTLSKLFGLDRLDSTSYLGADSITFDVALDQVDFMPLISVDSMSGVIVTDWYSLDNGNTRMKINIRVINQEITDESLTVSLFTQTLSKERWVDNGINTEQSKKIKESILSSARALKLASEL
tara:strand:- start:5327 stop:5893 length:567 start_codon:yes stop_codon:yes gene_type:complete